MATTAARQSPPGTASPAPAPPAARPRRQKEACDLLEADLKAVKAPFKAYEALIGRRRRPPARKRPLAD